MYIPLNCQSKTLLGFLTAICAMYIRRTSHGQADEFIEDASSVEILRLIAGGIPFKAQIFRGSS